MNLTFEIIHVYEEIFILGFKKRNVSEIIQFHFYLIVKSVVPILVDFPLQAQCCQDNMNSYCCSGNTSAPVMDTCSCEGCWLKLSHKIDKAFKATGGVGLFFSFTEVRSSYRRITSAFNEKNNIIFFYICLTLTKVICHWLQSEFTFGLGSDVTRQHFDV